MLTNDHPVETLADDIIWGVDGEDGIAAFLGLKPRKAYYLIEHGRIPVKRFGHKTISASRSQLRHLFGAENAA